jgi:8-oxo-dGTP diphosphatase
MNLDAGIAQIQFRAPSLDKDSYIQIANDLYALCRKYNSRLVVNCNLDWCQHIQTVDIHLNSQRLKDLFNSGMSSADIDIYSASCHSSQEIGYANALNIGAVLIGPVQHTLSHSEGKPLGWPGFSKLCGQSNRPVYAVGGLGKNELATALVNGAQGIAGIRDFMTN